MARIGFLGLGNMGLPMAVNLGKAGHQIVGFDVAAAAQAAARDEGLELAPDAPAAIAGAETVITMLPAGEHVLEVYRSLLGTDAATAGFPSRPRDGGPARGTLWIDCSTIDVQDARAAHAQAVAAGMLSLDAPVSGGTSGAKAATLTFMAGGAEPAFARGKPLLEAMGKRIVHCGEAGAGQAAKICNNLILGVSMIAVSEAFVLAERLGLSASALFEVASASSGQCWSLTNYCPVPGLVPRSPANQDYRAGFAARLMLKDLRLAENAAKASDSSAELARHAARLFARFADDGHGEEDFSAIIKAVRQASGER